MKGFVFLGLCVSSLSVAQKTDSVKVQEIETLNFTKRLPVTKEIIKVERDLANKNLGQDLPILLKNQTSVLSSSDTGNGVGYTDFRIRGVAGTSINVMLNGVPYNDSESQGTFFVNVPDLASSASQIVIQRGVGTSSNGVAAFGASVNILTKEPSRKPYFQTDLSYGSFNSQKQSFEAGTGGLLGDKFSLMARYSMIKSDGYIERASSNLRSYNITALFKTEKTKLKLLAFGGKEKTYQSWNGIDEATYLKNRRYNYSGYIKDANGERFYDNETDNYQQNHYHFILNQKLSDFWDLETTLHYTKGKGFYENYKQNQKLSKYNLQHIGGERADFIRKKWLDNDFYGIVYQVFGKYDRLKLNFGGAGNQYIGWHFGNVSSALKLPQFPYEHEYYRNKSKKNDLSVFGKVIYNLHPIEFFGDMQFRHIQHWANIHLAGDDEGGNFNRVFSFYNPKLGLNVNFNEGKVYFSYALANREPNRKDIIAKNDVQSEQLHDFELGVEKKWNKFSFSFNAYYMHYINQLVFSGKINNVGGFIRENSGKSYRRGLELGVQGQVFKNLQISANANLSQNKNLDFHIEDKQNLKNLGTTNIALSPDFIGNISINYQVSSQFNLFLQNQYVSKQYLDNTQNEKLSIPSYNLLDFGASYHLKLKRQDLHIYFNLNNVLDRKYMNKGYVYDKAPYFFPQAGRNFMLGMSLKFF
ncbi:MAG: TonB-dependent receptor [Flavobacteriaceae bacterium]|nr:TonB-dependent receptor [Flavobacteriaceae bacterium]